MSVLLRAQYSCYPSQLENMIVLLVNTLQTEPISGAQSYVDLTQPLGPGTNSCPGEGGKEG